MQGQSRGDAPSAKREATHDPVPLGTVDCPSGILVLLDPGLAHHWERRGIPEHRRGPVHDLEICGPDARRAGLAFDRSYDPLHCHDVRDPDAVVRSFAAFAEEGGFDARATVLPEPIPHAERARRCLEAREPGGGSFVYDGLWAVAIGDLPKDQPLPVVGRRIPGGEEFAGRFRSIDIVVDPDAEVAASHRVDGVMVDHGQLACVDLDVLDDLHAMRSLDGKADYVFWGTDAPALAEEHSAGRVSEREFGWMDVPVDDVGRYAKPIQKAAEERGLRIAVDYRPHCHVEQINRQVRASDSRAGQISVGGRAVCGFDNRWGDGLFAVFRDVDENGRLVRVRVDVGSEDVQRRMRRLAHRWQGALVTKAVLEGGEPPRFVDRHEPTRREDSGWVISSGAEPEDDPGFVVVPMAELQERYPELKPLLGEAIGARFRRTGDGTYDREA